MNEKFKKGDVIFLKCSKYAAEYGALAVVNGYEEELGGFWLNITWSRNDSRVNGQSDGNYNQDSFGLYDRSLFLEPDFTLEEIAAAQDMING